MTCPIDLNLSQAADRLASGTLSAVELCRACLARVAEVESRIQAFVHLDPDEVMAQAEAADQRRAMGKALSRYDGIPVALKDNLSVAGQPCTCASRILAGYTGAYDATVVRRLKAAGVVLFGRTNMDEFAMGSSTENSALKQTRNPWNTACVPGGSSGGAAAAVAARCVTAALGSDTGGSIRQPAAFCGLVGLKPTYGRVSRYGLVAYASSLDQIGPITRSVGDAAILLNLISGQDDADATSLSAPPPVAADLPGSLPRGLRIGLPREYVQVDGLDPQVKEAIEQAVRTFRDMGAEVVEVSLPHTSYAIAAYYIIATAEASANLARFDGIRYGFRDRDGESSGLLEMYRQSRANGFGQEVKRRIILGTYVLSSGYYDAYYLRAQKVRTLIRRDFEQAFQSCDVILSPTTPTAAFRPGEFASPLEMYLSDIYTISANLAGLPALSVPCGLTPDRRPLGVQLFAPALDESLLLRAADALEKGVGTLGFPDLGPAGTDG